MGFVFWFLEIWAWILLIVPQVKKYEFSKEECRKYCKTGCSLGIGATICFMLEMYARNNAMWKGDVSEQLLVALLSITMIPLGICIIIFVITHMMRK